MLRPLLFALMLLASVTVLITNAQDRRKQVGAAREPLEAANADLTARIGIVGLGTTGVNPANPVSRRPLELAVGRYRQLLRTHPQSQVIARRIGILLGVLDGPPAAWRWLRSRPDGAYSDLWRDAYAPGTLSTPQLSAALRRLDALRSSWYGELVRAQLYRKAGAYAQARGVMDRLRARLRPGVTAFFLVAGLALLALPLGSLIWVALLVAYRRGNLRPVGRRQPLAAVPWHTLGEAFTVWFFGITVGGWAIGRILAASGLGREHLSLASLAGLLLAIEVAASAAGGALLIPHLWGREENRPDEPPSPADPVPETPRPVAGETPAVEPGVAPGAVGASEREQAHPARAPLSAEIGYGIVTYLAAVPLLILTAALLSRFLKDAPTPPNPAMTMAMRAHGFWQWLLLFLVVAVAAPIAEELFFRGALYGIIRRRAGAGVAIAATSAVFALVHPQLPLGFFPILALGVVFAGAVELRRSLIPSIVAHMLNNSVALLLIVLIRTP